MTCIDSPAVVSPATTPCLACSPPRSVIQRAVIPKQIVWAEVLHEQRSYASPPNPPAKQGPTLRARQPSTESIASTGRAAAHQLQWRSWSHCELGTVGGFCKSGRAVSCNWTSRAFQKPPHQRPQDRTQRLARVQRLAPPSDLDAPI